MKYFTNNPLERLMMQAPPPQQERRGKPAPPKDHPYHGCKRCGESCVLPCYRGVEVIPSIPTPDRTRSRSIICCSCGIIVV